MILDGQFDGVWETTIIKIPGIKFSAHFLRHTHATLAKKNGASDFDLQADLGHASPATTAKYIHHVGRVGTSHALRKKSKHR
jgi:integrase